jgi:hypothetical protein
VKAFESGNSKICIRDCNTFDFIHNSQQTFFGISCRQKSENFRQIEVELSKHREKSPWELWDQYFNVLFQIFHLWHRPGVIVFSHCQTNHFMFTLGKFKFLLIVARGILKKFVNKQGNRWTSEIEFAFDFSSYNLRRKCHRLRHHAWSCTNFCSSHAALEDLVAI